MARYEVALTGVPRVLKDGNPINIGRKKAAALFYYLLLNEGSADSGSVAELLWPDNIKNKNNLRTIISHLNAVFGNGMLQRKGTNLCLNDAIQIQTDVQVIRSLVEKYRYLLSESNHPERRLELLEEAAAHWHGRFLTGFFVQGSAELDSWMLSQQYRLDQTMDFVLSTLVEEYERREQYEQAVAYGCRWVTLDPVNEESHRSLMRLYAALGQRNAAVRQYQMCARYLEAEAGTNPEEDTVCLYNSIKTGRYRPAPAFPSIVIIPFDNLSPDPRDAYIADGLTDEIANDLAQIKSLRVISRTSSRIIKSTGRNIKSLHEELRIDYAVEGSVCVENRILRVIIQLIDARTDLQLWSKKYSDFFENVFEVQEKVSRAIVNALRLHITTEEKQKLIERPFDDAQVYSLYLQVRQLMFQRTRKSLDQALHLAKACVETAGEHELLLALFGHIHLRYLEAAIDPDPAHIAVVESCIKKIFANNPSSPNGYYLSGYLHYRKANLQQAVRDAKKALKLSPGYAEALILLAIVYTYSGRENEAESLFHKLATVDPLTPFYQIIRGNLAIMQGKTEEGYAAHKRAFEMDPQDPLIGMAYGITSLRTGRTDEGLQVLDRVVALEPESAYASHAMLRKCIVAGNKTKALTYRTPELEAASKTSRGLSWMMAESWAILGEAKEAMDWLENAVSLGFINYRFFSEHNPYFADIRDEPRFRRIIESAEEKWRSFEV